MGFFKVLLITVLALYLAAMLLIYVVQRKLIYHPQVPTRISVEEQPLYAQQFGFQIIKVDVRGSGAITSYYAPPARENAPVILFFHGNATAAHQTLGRFRKFQDRGWGVLSAEFPGYENNPGKPTETSILASADQHYRYLRALVGDERIVVSGESLGAASAVHLASENKPAAMVLAAPFTSLTDMAKKMMPMFPAGLLTKDKFLSREKMPAVTAPLLLFHGARDEVVPYEMGETLAGIHQGDTSFVTIQNGGHMLWDHDLPVRILTWADARGIGTAQ